MKKSAIIAGAVSFLFLTATVNAQTEPAKQVPTEQTPVTTTQTTTTTSAPATTTTTTMASSDKWNNYDKAKYAMLPMPEALTTEKIFPVIGKFDVTDKDGAATQLTISLDETNKGIAWIDGLPQGRIKANLRQSPAVYKIPEQKLGEEKDAKTVAEGVLIYDKDANQVNLCIGCKYNVEDPSAAFAPAPVEEVAPAAKPTKKSVAKNKKKEVKVKPVIYSGTKVIEVSSAIQAQPQTQTTNQ
ncbi:MAG: hypothetical protein ABIR18_11075 [Chitinophagaceae bacterium]